MTRGCSLIAQAGHMSGDVSGWAAVVVGDAGSAAEVLFRGMQNYPYV